MFSKFSLISLFLILSITCVMSQEYIVERVPQGDRSFVIEYERVDIKIKEQAARVTIEEKLKNNSSSDMEATLIFPMPADASISNFSMLINGKKVEGKIMDKDEAASIYESIVRQLKDPGLLENIGSGMFRARIYPIPARGETKISINYSQVLSSDLGLCKFKLPLAKKTSDWPVKELTIGVELSSSVPVKSFYSPTHNMSIKKDGDKSVKAGFEDTSYKGDKDFVLYYGVSEEDFGLNLLTYKDRGDDQGFFLLIASPGQELDKTKVLPKDIIFIMDTSGSMYDEDKITYAQKALKFCLSNLNGKDRFNVVTFNSVTDFYSNKLVDGTEENIKKAKTFVDTLKPLGGTNIDEAFRISLKQFSEEKRPQYIVFLTDGLPTQGETDTNAILKNISAENKAKVRIFSFGVGTDVNTLLLDLMAEQNQGYTSYLKAGEEMEVEISSFFTKISHPVLSDLSLDFGKIKVKDMYPKELPDLFRGSQLILTGRYTDAGHTAITMSGKVNGETKKYVYEKTFPENNSDNSFIPCLWATRKIGYLLNEIRLHGENRETVEEIKALSVKYGIVTPYTSFLIQEEVTGRRPVSQRAEDDYDERLYSNMPYVQGRDDKSGGYSSDSSASGEVNVQASKVLKEYEKADTVQPAPASEAYRNEGLTKDVTESIKTVEDKTFYLKSGIWTDSLYKDGKDKIEVKFLSDKYFELLKTCPKLGKYLSVGNNVIVIFEGKAYHISDK